MLALAAHFLLIAGLLWSAWPSAGVLVIVPLLLAVPGLWRGRRYTYAWASMLLTLYCAGLLAEVYMRPTQLVFWRGLAVIAALEFVGLILFVRVQAAEARIAAGLARSSAQTAE
jgi:uncharacterized membrane protein